MTGVGLWLGRLGKNWSVLTLGSIIVLLALLGTSCNGFFVDPTLTAVTITPSAPSIAVGTTQQMTATGTYDDGSTNTLTGSSVSWSSSSPTTATINSSGLVTATSNVGSISGSTGVTTTISATSGTITATTQLTVILPITNLTLTCVPASGSSITNCSSYSMTVGGSTLTLEAMATVSGQSTPINVSTSATWTSNNSNVTPSGGLISLGSGAAAGQTALITATYDGYTASATISVN
jgi:hypothetical protein